MSTVMRKWFVYYCIVAPRGSLRHMRRVLLMPSGDTHADAPETQNANYQCFHILFLHCHKRGGVRTFRRDTVPCLLFRSFHLLTNRMQGGAVVYVPRVLKRPKVLVKDDVNHRCCREMTL